MNNNARNPIPEELHVYSYDEGTVNGSTPYSPNTIFIYDKF